MKKGISLMRGARLEFMTLEDLFLEALGFPLVTHACVIVEMHEQDLRYLESTIFSSSSLTRFFSSVGPSTFALLPQLSTQRVISSNPESVA